MHAHLLSNVLTQETAPSACLALANTDVLTGTVICQRLSYQYVAVPALLLSSAKQLVIVTCVFQALVSTDATIAS